MVASIGCSFSGTVLLLQNHYPRFRGAPSGHFRMLTKRPPSVDSGLACGPNTAVEYQPWSSERLFCPSSNVTAIFKILRQMVYRPTVARNLGGISDKTSPLGAPDFTLAVATLYRSPLVEHSGDRLCNGNIGASKRCVGGSLRAAPSPYTGVLNGILSR